MSEPMWEPRYQCQNHGTVVCTAIPLLEPWYHHQGPGIIVKAMGIPSLEPRSHRQNPGTIARTSVPSSEQVPSAESSKPQYHRQNHSTVIRTAVPPSELSSEHSDVVRTMVLILKKLRCRCQNYGSAFKSMTQSQELRAIVASSEPRYYRRSCGTIVRTLILAYQPWRSTCLIRP